MRIIFRNIAGILKKLLLLWCFSATNLYAQNLIFNHLISENSLTSNSVVAITQSANGYMWFATPKGLNRFDGIVNKTFSKINPAYSGLYSSYIVSLLYDSKKRLWVGTANGLNVYDEENDRFLRVKVNREDNATIRKIYEDSKGNIWIGTNSGLFSFKNDDTSTVIRHTTLNGDNLTNLPVLSICEDYKGNVWVGSNRLIRLWQQDGKYRYVEYFNDPADPKSLSGNPAPVIYEDSAQNLWIGTSKSGLNLYDRQHDNFKHFTRASNGIVHDNIRTLIYHNKELWIGTQEGLSILNVQNNSVRSYQTNNDNLQSLSNNSIHSFFRDLNNSVWIGTYFGGVNRVDDIATPFNSIKNDKNHFTNNVVSYIVEDLDESLWMTTEGGGLAHYNPLQKSFRVFKHDTEDTTSIGSNQVKNLYIDKDKNLWCGTNNGGLNVYNRATGTFKRILLTNKVGNTVPILAITEDKDGVFWVSTSYGVRLFKRTGTELSEIDAPAVFKDLMATILHIDAQNSMWLGTVSGLLRYRNGQLVNIIEPNIVYSILEDKKGRIWVGLEETGLGVFNTETNRIDIIPATGDIKGVLSILEDAGGNLWLSSNSGIHRYNPTTQMLEFYNATDGITNREFLPDSKLRNKKGELFFGGLHGVTHFVPEDISVNTFKAPIVFTGLKVNDKDVSPHTDDGILTKDIGQTNTLVLKSGDNIFSISFAILNYVKSNKNKYSYTLKGFDENWKQTTNNLATYSNLKEGTYQLYVKGANNDGVWTDPIVMDIKVLPPVWKTWWAYLFYLIVVCSLIFLITRVIFIRAVLKREHQLHQHKLNFFTNVSHEVRTHLSLITTPVERMLENQQATPNHEQVLKVKRNTDRLLKLVNELLDFRKVDSNSQSLTVAEQNIIPLLKEIFSSFEDIAREKGIETSFTCPDSEVLLFYDELQIEKVFFNLLSNALKFTSAGGSVSVLVKTDSRHASIIVADTGKGIPEQYQGNLFTNFYQVADYGDHNTGYGLGLALSRKITELHHGTIDVESRAAAESTPGYTRFTVSLPKGVDYFKSDPNVTIVDNSAVTTESQQSMIDHLSETPGTAIVKPEGQSRNNSILVVEDNQELRESLVQSLGEFYEVYEAENGKIGYDIAREFIPDIIVSDVMMPVMDGYQLTKNIKTDERTSHIPLVLLTAKFGHEDQWEGLQRGADVYLSKPFSLNLLLLNLRNLLATQKQKQQKVLRDVVRLHAEAESENAPLAEDDFLNRTIVIIDKELDNPDFGVEKLSRAIGMSAPVLYKKLRATANLSVNELIKLRRFRRAAALILEGRLKINEIAYAVGFDDRKYFSKEFKKYYGVSPSEFTEASSSGLSNINLDELKKQES